MGYFLNQFVLPIREQILKDHQETFFIGSHTTDNMSPSFTQQRPLSKQIIKPVS